MEGKPIEQNITMNESSAKDSKNSTNHHLQLVQLVTMEGVPVDIQFLDLIHAEIDEGVYVFAGRVHDVFG